VTDRETSVSFTEQNPKTEEEEEKKRVSHRTKANMNYLWVE